MPWEKTQECRLEITCDRGINSKHSPTKCYDEDDPDMAWRGDAGRWPSVCCWVGGRSASERATVSSTINIFPEAWYFPWLVRLHYIGIYENFMMFPAIDWDKIYTVRMLREVGIYHAPRKILIELETVFINKTSWFGNHPIEHDFAREWQWPLSRRIMFAIIVSTSLPFRILLLGIASSIKCCQFSDCNSLAIVDPTTAS